MGHDWGEASAERTWDEVRSLSPVHAGMSYRRLEELGGIQWPCYDETHPGELFLHSRLWENPVPGMRVPFVPVDHDPPVDRLDADFPVRLTTGRRLDSYNTGVQTGAYTSPLRRGESLDVSPEDLEAWGVAEGERVRVVSRRGAVEVPVRADPGLRPGLTFMTLHFQDDVATNLLTIDATDPKSGTAEFKATAIRVEKLAAPVG
jgi:formate dehydrogenase major subunit